MTDVKAGGAETKRAMHSLWDERNHPNYWYNRASDMHAAAGALWFSMGEDEAAIAKRLGLGEGFSLSIACSPVYLMICGLALELIIKAVLVQRKTEVTQFNKKHQLSELVRLLDIKPTHQELQLLKLYQENIIWAGRYPTPRKDVDEVLQRYWLDFPDFTRHFRASESTPVQI